jgi:hypothetical protein
MSDCGCDGGDDLGRAKKRRTCKYGRVKSTGRCRKQPKRRTASKRGRAIPKVCKQQLSRDMRAAHGDRGMARDAMYAFHNCTDDIKRGVRTRSQGMFGARRRKRR